MGIDHERFKYNFKGLDFGLTGVESARILPEIVSRRAQETIAWQRCRNPATAEALSGLNRRGEVANAACDFSTCHHTGSGRFQGELPRDRVGKEIPSRHHVDA